MPSPILLPDLLDELNSLADGLLGGQLSPVAWHNEVAAVLFEYHLAEYAAAADVPVDDVLVLDAVKRTIAAQMPYLNAFLDAIEAGDYTDRDGALRSRAALYAGSLKESYWRGTMGEDLPAYPGDGSSECGGHCQCSWEEQGDGMYWVRGAGDSCATCVQRGEAWAPYQGAEA